MNVDHHNGLVALAAEVPASIIRTDPDSLSTRSRDWWPLPRLLEASGVQLSRPLAVLMPQTTDQVASILRWARSTSTSVVPRGLGSGVCGGVMPDADSVVLDLSRLDKVLRVDVESRVVHVEAGIRGDLLESVLAEYGLTAGHYPQSIALSTPGGWVAAAGAGQATPAYGAIEDRLLGLTVVLADGSVVRQRAIPRNSVGPDFRSMFVGSEGTLGVITEVELALSDLPPSIVWRAYALQDLQACWSVAREIKRRRFAPFILRGWDPVDARRAFGPRLGHDADAVGLVAFRGDDLGLEDRLAAADTVYASHGGRRLDDRYGEDWWAHRLNAVEVFELVMGPERSMGEGTVLDTFEVVGLWRDLNTIYRAVSAVLTDHASDAGCHFSHVYDTGAGLYFTFFIKAPTDREAEAQYHRLWASMLHACQLSGGSISHHHGVGRLKRAAMEADIGPGAVHLTRLVRRALDPDGILNPGLQVAS